MISLSFSQEQMHYYISSKKMLSLKRNLFSFSPYDCVKCVQSEKQPVFFIETVNLENWTNETLFRNWNLERKHGKFVFKELTFT